MDENYEELFERIRAKCRQQRWHGPDISNPWKIVERERLRHQEAKEAFERLRKENPTRKGWVVAFRGHATVYWYDRNGKQYAINADTDLESFPLQTDFEYAPATEEELAAAEKQLGYPLPPLLRALYANVANGGFGPGYGLDGVRGYVRAADFEQDWTWQKHERPIDLSIYLQKYGLEYFELLWDVWPDSLITLCHWGCGYFSHLDCISGRVLYGGVGADGYGLHTQALSLYEWLDLWLNGINLEERTYSGSGGQKDE